jgi:SAM-dependent methyltransferase
MKKLRYNYFKSNSDSFSKRKFFGFINSFFNAHIFAVSREFYHMPFMSSLGAGDSHSKSWIEREVLYEYTDEKDAVYSKEKSDYYFNKILLPLFVDRIGYRDSIIDIGCNSGYNLSLLYDKGFHNLYGIEPQKSAVEFIKKNRQYINITEGFFEGSNSFISADCLMFIGSIDRIPYSSRLFDMINKCAKKYVYIATGEFGENFPRDWHFEMARIGFFCVEKITTVDQNGKYERFNGDFDVALEKIGSSYLFARI